MLYFGVDYYPEQWPEECWLEDAQIMAEVDFNVVRLAEFAWSKIEPNEGHYDFDSLDRAITLLASYDMRVVLGTPTASPPPWLMTKYLVRFQRGCWVLGVGRAALRSPTPNTQHLKPCLEMH